jgi:hypothetical protein
MNNVIEFKKNKPRLDLKENSDILGLFNKFEENFQNGEKSIAFNSTNYRSSQEKCLLLAADYFNKKYPSLKLAIVSFQFRSGILREYLNQAKVESVIEQVKLSKNLTLINWESCLQRDPLDIIDEFDLVLWDLPEVEFLQKQSELLTRFFEHMDSLYIVSMKFEMFDEEHFKRTVHSFYLDHGLDIKMILPWSLGQKSRIKKSRLTRFKELLGL